jgi:hypothetical protein
VQFRAPLTTLFEMPLHRGPPVRVRHVPREIGPVFVQEMV